MYRDTSKEFATKYMWWFFLIQKAPLPEHMIGADPEFFLNEHLEVQNGTPGALTGEARKEYKRCFCTPEAIHASCEDFRATAEIDLEMDAADENADAKLRLLCSHPGVQRVRSGSSGTFSRSGNSTRARLWKDGPLTQDIILQKNNWKKCCRNSCASSATKEDL
jgi:hypothetical protein